MQDTWLQSTNSLEFLDDLTLMVTQKLTSRSFNLDVSHLYLFSAKAAKRLVDQSQGMLLRLQGCNYLLLVNQFKEINPMNIVLHRERDQDLDPPRLEELVIREDEPLSYKTRIVNHRLVLAASTIWRIQEGFLNIKHLNLIAHLPEWISQLVFLKQFTLESILVQVKRDRDHLKTGKDRHRDCKKILPRRHAQEEMSMLLTVAVQWEWAHVEVILLT